MHPYGNQHVLRAERSAEELEEEWSRILPQLTEALAAFEDGDANTSTTFTEDDTSHRLAFGLILMWGKNPFCRSFFFSLSPFPLPLLPKSVCKRESVCVYLCAVQSLDRLGC